MSPLNHDPEGVKYALKQSGLTQREVAKQMGISPAQVSEILAGTRNLTPPNLKKLAGVLNCPPVVLEAKLTEAAG